MLPTAMQLQLALRHTNCFAEQVEQSCGVYAVVIVVGAYGKVGMHQSRNAHKARTKAEKT